MEQAVPAWGSWQTWYAQDGATVTGAPSSDQQVFSVVSDPWPLLDLQGDAPLVGGFVLGGAVPCAAPSGYVVDHVRLLVSGSLVMNLGCQVQLTCVLGGETSTARWRTTDGLPDVVLDEELPQRRAAMDRARRPAPTGGVLFADFGETTFLQERCSGAPLPLTITAQVRRRSSEAAVNLTISDVVLEPFLRSQVSGKPDGFIDLEASRAAPVAG